MYLRTFGCTTYVHQSIDKLEPRSMKGTFLGYALGIKGYRIYISKKDRPNIVIAKNDIFNELAYPHLTSGKGSVSPCVTGKIRNKDTASVEMEYGMKLLEESLQTEVSVEPEDNAQTEAVVEPEDNEYQTEVSEGFRQTGLEGYPLARNRTRREIHPPTRFVKANLIAYALAAVQQMEIEEPRSYEEEILGGNKSKWLQAMDEEMDSLQKNKTWVVVPKPENKKIVDCK
uniref:Retroviral polymerase SH3-like domain-containing protein n=1 Tax=Cannabis sativa TaxID=3483 RepID=A0A803Q0W6_CANSA